MILTKSEIVSLAEIGIRSSKPMRESVTYVTSCLIGWGLAQHDVRSETENEATARVYDVPRVDIMERP